MWGPAESFRISWQWHRRLQRLGEWCGFCVVNARTKCQKLGGSEQHESVALQFQESEVGHQSPWAKVKMNSGLCSFQTRLGSILAQLLEAACITGHETHLVQLPSPQQPLESCCATLALAVLLCFSLPHGMIHRILLGPSDTKDSSHLSVTSAVPFTT